MYIPLIFSILFSSLKSSGKKGLPLDKFLKAFIATCFSFLKGIIKSGLNWPDSLLLSIAVLPQYTQNVAAVSLSATISAPQFLHLYEVYKSPGLSLKCTFWLCSTELALLNCCNASNVYSPLQYSHFHF